MADGTPHGLFIYTAIAGGTAIGVLYIIACQVRNQTSVHELKARVETLRAEYDRRRQALKANEVIIAEPVEEAGRARKAA